MDTKSWLGRAVCLHLTHLCILFSFLVVVDQLSADFAAIGNAVMKGADLLNDMINDMSSHYNY